MTITKMGTITVITMITNNHVIIKNIETHVVNAEKNVNKEAYEAEHQYEPQQHDAYMNDESESHNMMRQMINMLNFQTRCRK